MVHLSINRCLAPLALALLLMGCNQILGETKTIRFTSETPVLKEDEAVIASRLREHTSTLSPVVSFAAVDGMTVITAKGSPPDAELQFLLGHRGVFVVRSESGLAWFSQKDIVDAQVGFDDQKRTFLNLKLSADGATRVARLSANSTGTIVFAEFDGERLTSARVSAPIPGGALQLSLNKPPDEAQLISTILRTGSLSFTPKAIEIAEVSP